MCTSETRALILAIARRRQKPGTGSSLEFMRRRTAMKQWPDPTDALHEIPWATVGGVATRHYAPERATIDLDILVERATARSVRERLQQAGFSLAGELTVGGSTWHAPAGTSIQVHESEEPWVGVALQLAQENRDLQGLPILPLPYFVLMKLRSGRTLDIADIVRMLGLASDADLDLVRDVSSRFEPDAQEDVESMIALRRLEMQPPNP